MLSTTYSAGIDGVEGYPVIVECNVMQTVPKFEIVGLGDLAIREAKERVTAAAGNSGIGLPDLEITVNLAPADKKKEGSAFDLPMLVGILRCEGTIHEAISLDDACFIGELSLSGEVRAVNGVLSMADAAARCGKKRLFVPLDNAQEASVMESLAVYGVRDIRQLIAHLNGTQEIAPTVFDKTVAMEYVQDEVLDFADVMGQQQAKRALEIAAAGQHNILLIGPPGTGKSMLAKRLPSILPELSLPESIEVTKIHSVCGLLHPNSALVSARPFRAPHHTISAAGLTGGGAIPRPGEISVAHNGVLFLDELPEFDRKAMESLRQPLEDGVVTITRANAKMTFPCKFMLAAAMNPCRCGYYGHPTKPCTCKHNDIVNYVSRISGPMLDRIDIQIEVSSLNYEQLHTGAPGERSAAIRARVEKARAYAHARYQCGGEHIESNAHLTAPQIKRYCVMDEAADTLLKNAYDSIGMSARGHDRILRVARTIADLDESEVIGASHIAEAIQFRCLDKKYFN